MGFHKMWGISPLAKEELALKKDSAACSQSYRLKPVLNVNMAVVETCLNGRI